MQEGHTAGIFIYCKGSVTFVVDSMSFVLRCLYGCQPDVVTYTACLTACQSRHQWQQALGLFLECPDCIVLTGDLQESSVHPGP